MARTGSIRYMGTKRAIVPHVVSLVEALSEPRTRFADLFAGTGSVAASLANRNPVALNDALEFPVALARARFLRRSASFGPRDLVRLESAVSSKLQHLREGCIGAIREEDEALRRGYRATRELIAAAQHVGNSDLHLEAARLARDSGSYRLVSLYFGRGYFSSEQAMMFDAYRWAIDELYPAAGDGAGSARRAGVRDVLIAAWLIAASRVANGPGHTAQFLRATSESGFRRVSAYWRRAVPEEFRSGLAALLPLGGTEWRRRNWTLCADSTNLPASARQYLRRSLLYADPPYTKDHYSRFYHVLETMFKYDYPSSSGQGRIRSDRHLSDFSFRSRASWAFAQLGATAADLSSTLIVSYPSTGLLSRGELLDALAPFGRVRIAAELPHIHSTLGGSPGRASSGVVECLYVLEP